VAGISIHPRHASQRHKGSPEYGLVRQLVDELPVPVLVSGGLQTADQARTAFERTGAAAVLLARGSLGNPWLFRQLLDGTEAEPSRAQILAEVDWVMERAVEHLGAERAARYLRKFYPWYAERLGIQGASGRELLAELQRSSSIDEARATLARSR
jgi:tRNA-dihydrouridine synthase